MLQLSIDVLDLDVRTYNVLRRHGILTLAQVMTYSASNMLEHKHFGLRSLKSLRHAIGVYLATSVFGWTAEEATYIIGDPKVTTYTEVKQSEPKVIVYRWDARALVKGMFMDEYDDAGLMVAFDVQERLVAGGYRHSHSYVATIDSFARNWLGGHA